MLETKADEQAAAVKAAEEILRVHSQPTPFSKLAADFIRSRGGVITVVGGISLDQLIEQGYEIYLPSLIRKIAPEVLTDITPRTQVAFLPSELVLRESIGQLLGAQRIQLLRYNEKLKGQCPDVRAFVPEPWEWVQLIHAQAKTTGLRLFNRRFNGPTFTRTLRLLAGEGSPALTVGDFACDPQGETPGKVAIGLSAQTDLTIPMCVLLKPDHYTGQ